MSKRATGEPLNASDEDVLHLEDADSSSFDIVLRGYDRRQVEDYIRRVEVALGDADRARQDDHERIGALEQELGSLRLALGDAERRAAGLPEPATRVGARIAELLRLAEEEAEEIVELAKERAARSTSERTAELDRRQAEIEGSADAADRLRMEAQTDANALRDKARQEATDLVRSAKAQAEEILASAREDADKRRRTAEEDIQILHDKAREEHEARLAAVEAEVADRVRQRDAITKQLHDLRQSLAAAAQPLGETES